MMLEQHIEALIFASEKPITPKEIKACLQESFGWEVKEEEFEQAVNAIREKYLADSFSFHLIMTGGGYEFMTKKDYAPVINTFLNQKAKKRLTRAALETLSIIAYKQPITKMEIEQIRGVNCDYTVQKLLEKELIVIAGRAETVGHPLTYATSEQFMDYFGINSPSDLPKLREIEAGHDNEIGFAPDIEEEVLADYTPAENTPSENASSEGAFSEDDPAEQVSTEETQVTENSETSETSDAPVEAEETEISEPVADENADEEKAEEEGTENRDRLQEFREEQLQKLHGKKNSSGEDEFAGDSDSDTETSRQPK